MIDHLDDSIGKYITQLTQAKSYAVIEEQRRRSLTSWAINLLIESLCASVDLEPVYQMIVQMFEREAKRGNDL